MDRKANGDTRYGVSVETPAAVFWLYYPQNAFTIRGMSTVSAVPGYYTPEEAAEIIGVSQSQITRYIQDEKLKATRVGRQILIEQGDVHRFERPPRGNPNFKRNTA